jgi:hypothetical protein
MGQEGVSILYNVAAAYCSYQISAAIQLCALAVTCVQHACVGKGGEARRGAVLYTVDCSYSRHLQALAQERVMAPVLALSSMRRSSCWSSC